MGLDVEAVKAHKHFVRARRQGVAAAVQGVQVQACRCEGSAMRYGLTASKKAVGRKAVDRNRTRRRLRALVRQLLPVHGQPSTDYIFVAQRPLHTLSPSQLHRAMLQGLEIVGRKLS